ncbi:hypothetical protein Tco_0351955 [Tanacetum coccineum]
MQKLRIFLKVRKITDAVKEDAEKISEVKDDPKKTELPLTSSSLYVSLGFGDQFLKLSLSSLSLSMLRVPIFVISEPTVITPVQESPLIYTVTTLPPPSVSTTPSVPEQTTTPIFTPIITTDAPIITTVVFKSDALSVVQLRVAKLEKDVSDLKKLDLSVEALAPLKTQVPSVVDNYLGSKVGDVFQKELKKHTPDLIQKYSLQQIPQVPKNQTPTVDLEQGSEKNLEEYDLESALYQSMHANKSFNRNPANNRLYHALMEALIEDENAMDKGVADTVKDHKRKHDDDEDDDDEDPLAGPNQGKKTKRRRTKESEFSKNPSSTKETPKGKAPSKGSKTGKSASAKEPVEEPIVEVVMDDAGDDVASEDIQPQDDSKPKTTKTLNPDWLRPPTPDPEWNKYKHDWNNPEGYCYPFNLSKPLPLQGPPSHRTIAVDYFFNNDLEYLKTSDPEAILGVKSVSANKLHGYGHLEEIVVKRSDQQLYKFKEGDFVDLNLNDIEDMLLLAVQHKLFHLEGSDIVDFIMALRMFTRSLILKRHVEDLQLSVESYQKKLNITKPQKTFPAIKFKEPYTPSYDPLGIFYEDLNEHKRVLRADELYKFSDGTLKSVRDEIHHRVLNYRLDYNTKMPKRKWTAVDQKRSGLMIELIDKQLREREIIRNLERLVGARELEMDYKLMTRTI